MNFRNINYNRNLDDSRAVIRPKRDWAVLIIIFFFLFVLTIFWGIYEYLNISRTEDVLRIEEEISITETLKKDQINNLLLDLNSRKANISKIKRESLIDPSI